MVVEYNYLKMSGEEFGWFQCDFDDFKKFFASRVETVKSDIRCICLKKGGREYIWSKNNVNLKGRTRGYNGWMIVKK